MQFEHNISFEFKRNLIICSITNLKTPATKKFEGTLEKFWFLHNSA